VPEIGGVTRLASLEVEAIVLHAGMLSVVLLRGMRFKDKLEILLLQWQEGLRPSLLRY
jgi:hypothetical protein